MNKYEAMFLINPDLDKKSMDAVTKQIHENIEKNGGSILSARVWAEKRRMYFSIKKKQEATYYLVDCNLPADSIGKMKQAYRLNESILRFLITRSEEAVSAVK